MARIKVSTEVGHDAEGYPYVHTAYHLYCDRCGSFRISEHISPPMSILLILFTVTGAWIWYLIGRWGVSGPAWLAWFFIFFVVVLLAIYVAWAHLGHKCRRCGNTRISRRDAFHHGSRGPGPIDVSPEKIHKHNLISDEPYMPFLVVVLAAVLLIPAIVLFMIVLLIGGVYEAYSVLQARRRPKGSS